MKAYLTAVLLRLILRVFYVFPIRRRKIVLTAFNGRLFSDSPKYIALEAVRRGGFEVVYALNKNARAELPAGVRRVDYRSLRHFFDLMTAQYVVVNSTGLSGLLPYRRKQTLINTWHGAIALKNIDNSKDWDRFHRRVRAIMGGNTKVFLSSCTRTSETYGKAMSVPYERFLHIGLPRNDLLFREAPEVREKVYRHFGIAADKKLVLYAPTFRDGPMKSMNGYGLEKIDVQRLLESLSARFGGEYVFLFKAHHDTLPESLGPECVNASEYADIQELLYASDVLVTDYSSCVWEQLLLERPAFLYTPDLEAYGREHTFGLPVEVWPCPVAEDNDALNDQIAAYDPEAARARAEAFFAYMGGRDTGTALERLFDEVIV